MADDDDDKFEDDLEDLKRHPAWKQAVLDFLAADFKVGDVVTHEWLYEHFLIAKPVADTPHAIAHKADMDYMQAGIPFKDCLLEEHQVALRSKPGVGYEIVSPKEQTAWAEREGDDDLRKALKRRIRRLANVKVEELNPAERKENHDAQARVGQMRSLLRRIARGEPPVKKIIG